MACVYFLNRKRTICVVTMNGTLAGGDKDALDRCLKEVMREPPKYLLLNLGGVTAIEASLSRPFALFQQSLRSSAKLVICGLATGVGRVLKAEGLVRAEEEVEDLVSALQTIMKLEKG
jgi:anti-anti-sigma regulatory factor